VSRSTSSLAVQCLRPDWQLDPMGLAKPAGICSSQAGYSSHWNPSRMHFWDLVFGQNASWWAGPLGGQVMYRRLRAPEDWQAPSSPAAGFRDLRCSADRHGALGRSAVFWAGPRQLVWRLASPIEPRRQWSPLVGRRSRLHRDAGGCPWSTRAHRVNARTILAIFPCLDRGRSWCTRRRGEQAKSFSSWA